MQTNIYQNIEATGNEAIKKLPLLYFCCYAGFITSRGSDITRGR